MSSSLTSRLRARDRRCRAAGDRRIRSIHEPYSDANVCSGAGSFRSTHRAAGPAARMSHGVVSVVIADTATATG